MSKTMTRDALVRGQSEAVECCSRTNSASGVDHEDGVLAGLAAPSGPSKTRAHTVDGLAAVGALDQSEMSTEVT